MLLYRRAGDVQKKPYLRSKWQVVYYRLFFGFFSECIGPAPITNENYPESLQGKTAKQGFEDYHMTYNLG